MDVQLHHISTGVHASIYAYRIPLPAPNDSAEATGRTEEDGLRAVKIVHAGPTGQRANLRPHDVRLEVEILKKVDHPNVIKLLDYTYLEDRMEHHLTLPLLSITLRELFDENVEEDGARWMQIFRSITFQLLSSLSFVHSQGNAHRDVKPSNIMFDWSGTLVLIDFGTAWAPALSFSSGGRGDEGDVGEVWKEEEGQMVCQVGTGPYRAPELLFSPPSYDARAIDVWATGCVLAEFWNPPRGASPPSSNDSNSDEGSGSEVDPLDERHQEEEEGRQGRRRELFDAAYGDLGLAASIFRVRGSPIEDNWPGFKSLPDANKITFPSSPSIPLASILSDLRASPSSAAIIDMLEDMLQLDPSRRVSAAEALKSPLFEPPLSLPRDYHLAPPHNDGGTPLEGMLKPWLSAARKHYAHILDGR